MSINTEINLLNSTKEELGISIMEKGVTVFPNDLFSTYPTRISEITTTAGDKDLIFKSLIDRSITTINVPVGTSKLRQSLFADCTALSSVTLPNSLVEIRDNAFKNCSSLSSITIPSSVTTLGHDAFENSGLTSIEIPDSVTSIGQDAFMECSSLATVTIGDGLTKIEANMFRECTAMTTLSIGDNVRIIDSYAFYNCRNLTELTIPESVTKINQSAFDGCSRLESITCMSTTPATISGGPFDYTNNCPIYVPEESVQAYKTAWPTYASRIQKIPEPVVTKQIFVPVSNTSDVTTGKYILFNDNAALNASLIKQTTSNSNGINAANNVISLNDSFCHYGSGVAIVPRSEFADAATFDYDALAQKTYWVDKSDNDTKYYLTPYGQIFRYSNHTTVPSTNITVGTATASQDSSTFVTFMTPNSTYLAYNSSSNTRRFGWFNSSALEYRSYLHKLVEVAAVKTADVTLTDSTTDEIFDYNNTAAPMINSWDTSYYNHQIASVRINDNVTELGGSAFYGNTYLTSVNIPDSVTSIGQYAFEDCTALATVTIGTGIQSIADEAFGGYNYNSSNLTSVTVKATTPPTLGSFVFNDSMSGEIINPNLVIYVPAASVDAYKSAWSEYADRIQAIPS